MQQKLLNDEKLANYIKKEMLKTNKNKDSYFAIQKDDEDWLITEKFNIFRVNNKKYPKSYKALKERLQSLFEINLDLNMKDYAFISPTENKDFKEMNVLDLKQVLSFVEITDLKQLEVTNYLFNRQSGEGLYKRICVQDENIIFVDDKFLSLLNEYYKDYTYTDNRAVIVYNEKEEKIEAFLLSVKCEDIEVNNIKEMFLEKEKT